MLADSDGSMPISEPLGGDVNQIINEEISKVISAVPLGRASHPEMPQNKNREVRNETFIVSGKMLKDANLGKEVSKKTKDDDIIASAVVNYSPPIVMTEGDGMDINFKLKKERTEYAVDIKNVERDSRGRVVSQVRVEMKGSDFEITPITPEEQSIIDEIEGTWSWRVSPKHKGANLPLNVNVMFLINSNGKVYPPLIVRGYANGILVNRDLVWELKKFFNDNWKWLWTVVVAPLIGYAWKRRRRIFNLITH